MLVEACGREARTLLELGSGGGNNASYLKRRFVATLVDVAPAMLEVSRGLNPECEHLAGDMRTVRLGREFDCVFLHDALAYLTTQADLKSTVEPAWTHCAPGGAALFAPDYVRENFRKGTAHGGTVAATSVYLTNNVATSGDGMAVGSTAVMQFIDGGVLGNTATGSNGGGAYVSGQGSLSSTSSDWWSPAADNDNEAESDAALDVFSFDGYSACHRGATFTCTTSGPSRGCTPPTSGDPNP